VRLSFIFRCVRIYSGNSGRASAIPKNHRRPVRRAPYCAMASIMVAILPFAGHVAPVRAVVAELIDRGHQVRVYTGASLRGPPQPLLFTRPTADLPKTGTSPRSPAGSPARWQRAAGPRKLPTCWNGCSSHRSSSCPTPSLSVPAPLSVPVQPPTAPPFKTAHLVLLTRPVLVPVEGPEFHRPG
jgi:hypothetical protein